MADGYVIELTCPQAAEGERLKEIWYAHISDRNRAIRAVRKAAGVGKAVAVEIVRTESHRILFERLALLEGEVRPDK
jgi:hypothetical protein